MGDKSTGRPLRPQHDHQVALRLSRELLKFVEGKAAELQNSKSGAIRWCIAQMMRAEEQGGQAK